MAAYRLWRPGSVLAVLVAFGAAAAYAAAARMSLRFEPEVGEECRHKLVISARLLESMQGGEGTPHESKGEVSATIEYVRKALSAADEYTKVKTRMLEGKVTAEYGEESATVELPPYSDTADVDRRGRFSNVEEELDLDAGICWDQDLWEIPDALLHLGIACGMWTSYPNSLLLPKDEVEVGGTWTNETEVSGGGKLSRTFTLEELTTFSGHQCAKIRERWRDRGTHTADLSGREVPAGEEPALESEYTTDAELLWYYDYEKSTVIYAEGSVQRGVHVNNRGGAGETESGGSYYVSGYESTTKSVANLKLTLIE